MKRIAFLALLSHWRSNPVQLVTLLAGIALATALWSGVQAVNAEARASYDAASATLGEGQFQHFRAADGGSIPQSTFVTLRRSGWLVSPVVEGRIAGVRIVGLDPLTAPGGLGPIPLTEQADLSEFLLSEGQVFGSAEAIEQVGDSLGAELVVDPNIAPRTLLADISVAQRLLGREGELDRLILTPGQPKNQFVLEDIAPNLTLVDVQSGSEAGRLTDSFHLNLTAFGFLSFAVGIFIVHSAIGLAFEQRRPVFRTIRALGVPLRSLAVIVIIELLVFAVIAGLLGVILGYFIASVLLPDVALTLRGLYGADVAGSLQFRASWWLSGMAIAVGGTILAGAAAIWRLTKMPLVASAGQRAHSMAAGRQARFLAAASVVLLLIAAVLAATATDLTVGFVLLGALLIGAALALPILLDLLLGACQRLSRKVKAQWFWADTRQQLPGLSLALMALLLAMAANVGVSTMVSSFRLTFVDFLDQRLASELYLTAEDAAQAEELTAYLEPKVEIILPIQSVETELVGLPTEVYGVRVHSTQRENWTFLEAMSDPWEQVRASTGILLNEQHARRSGVWTGSVVALGGARLTVAGVYGDYGNPIGQAIISEDLFAEIYPDVVATRFGLRLPEENVPNLVAELNDRFELSPESIVNQAAIKAFSLEVFERTFTVTGALNVLTLGVAGFAILMSLLTLATIRVPQLAPAWALGMTRRNLGQLELIRAVMLAAFTAVIALPLGLALAWVLLAIVNVAAFGWKLPMFLFPIEYMRLGVFALLAAALAALWPAFRLSQTPPADLLKVFANER